MGQQFSSFRQAAAQRLAGRDPERIAQRAGVVFDGRGFQIPALGRDYVISWPELECSPDCSEWMQLS